MGSSHNYHPLTAGNLTPPLLLLLLLLLVVITAQYSAAQSPPSSNGDNNNNNNPYFASTSFSPSMAIVIVVLISVFFFLVFFSIYIRQCTGEHGSVRVAIAAGGGGGGRSRSQRGLDPEVLVSFPTFVYSEVKERKIGKGSLECAVCLCEFEDDETLRLLPKCSHVFHHDCIDVWLAAHVTCPVCRSNLVPDPNAIDDRDQSQESPVVCNEVNATEQTDRESEPTATQDHVTVEIDGADEERKAEIENLERFVNMKRAKSRAGPARFQRSHSTGHSLLVQPGQNLDRFTLRLPEDVRREIVEGSKLQRTKSLVAFRGEGSSRRGYRGEGSVVRAEPGYRLGRSDRWGSFLMRTLSVKNWGRRGEPGSGSVRGEAGSSVKGGGFSRMGEPGSGSVKGPRFNAVIAPFDCYGGGKSGFDANEDESSTAALNRV